MESAKERLRDNLLEIMVEAALGGHDLEPWKPIQEIALLGSEAVCRQCGLSIYASSLAVFSHLEVHCPAVGQGYASRSGCMTVINRH